MTVLSSQANEKDTEVWDHVWRHICKAADLQMLIFTVNNHDRTFQMLL